MAFLALFFLLLAPAVHVVGQQGFLSIDCGLDANTSGYTDTSTGIVYVSDGPYVDAGVNLKVAAEYDSQWTRRFLTVRSFPSGERNCYALPTEVGAKYLVRLLALYGNHDGRNDSSSLEFDLHLGPNYWDTVYGYGSNVFEALFVAWASWAPVCLVNTGRGTPFVSALELRQLPAALYPHVTASQFMSFYARRAMGASVRITRYPNDPYDRYWWGSVGPQWANMLTQQTIQSDPSFLEPLYVLQTAVTTFGNATTWNHTWQEARARYSFMVFLHFADFEKTQARQFVIYFNGNRLGLSDKPYSPQYLVASCVYSSGWYRATDRNYNITLTATATSTLPPMLNALELYTLLALDYPTTFRTDFDAIMAIKSEYGVKKNWMGDPCSPAKYTWDGVKCSNTSGTAIRITSLNLSNSYLHGVISKNFVLLTALENLDLSYNNLSGSIPDSLPSLPSLRVLNLSGNHLNGDSLCKNYTGSLVFRYESDGHMCNKIISPSPSKNRTAIIAISVVVPVLVVVVLLLACYIWREKTKTNVSIRDPARDPQPESALGGRKGHGKYLPNTENRRFTYKELKKLTNNFKQCIGQGGFGPVYYGRLEGDTEIAVKMRSASSSHGLDEFLAEVKSLTKVHHRNLVSLVGYCWERDHLALVYEYMSQGSLFNHLRGKNGPAETLNWRTRVRVLLEAAQGLDYLHKGCNLPTVHQDVKTSNILLNHNLQAKIADFGLSKTFLSDTQTHISAAIVAGTSGYMDPECYVTGRITESNDVYSFGIVLFEVITGEPPIVPGHGHIIQRVQQKITTGDISLVADARLGGAYNISSMWKVVDIAMMCTSNSAAQRPTMAAVVVQLKESLALEEAREDSCARANPGRDIRDSVFSSNPLAR